MKLFKRKSGFTLIEMSIVLVIIGMIISASSVWISHYARSSAGKSLGDETRVVTGGVMSYVVSNYDSIINPAVAANGIVGFANKNAPTITELKAKGFLSSGVQATNSQGTGWTIEVLSQPVGCVYPSCDVAAHVTTSAQILKTGTSNPDYKVLAAAQDQAGGDSGFSDDATPGSILGKNGVWSWTNPLNKAGVFGMQAGYGSQMFSQFVRMGDSRAVTLSGGLQVNGGTGIGTDSKVTVTSANGSTAVLDGATNDPRLRLTNTSTGVTVGASTVTGLTANDPATNTSLVLGTIGLIIDQPGQKNLSLTPGIGLSSVNSVTGGFAQLGPSGIATNKNIDISNSSPTCSSAAPWNCNGLVVHGSGLNSTTITAEEFAQLNGTTGQWAGVINQQVQLNVATKGTVCTSNGQTARNAADTTEILICVGGVWGQAKATPACVAGTYATTILGAWQTVPIGPECAGHSATIWACAGGGGGGGGGWAYNGSGGGGGGGGGAGQCSVALAYAIPSNLSVMQVWIGAGGLAGSGNAGAYVASAGGNGGYTQLAVNGVAVLTWGGGAGGAAGFYSGTGSSTGMGTAGAGYPNGLVGVGYAYGIGGGTGGAGGDSTLATAWGVASSGGNGGTHVACNGGNGLNAANPIWYGAGGAGGSGGGGFCYANAWNQGGNGSVGYQGYFRIDWQ